MDFKLRILLEGFGVFLGFLNVWLIFFNTIRVVWTYIYAYGGEWVNAFNFFHLFFLIILTGAAGKLLICLFSV